MCYKMPCNSFHHESATDILSAIQGRVTRVSTLDFKTSLLHTGEAGAVAVLASTPITGSDETFAGRVVILLLRERLNSSHCLL